MLSLNCHSGDAAHEDVVPVVFEVDGPANGSGKRQAEEADLNGRYDEELGS